MSEELQEAMIFAAGFGTRMAPLTDDRPKPLIKVAGQPLIEHALRWTEGMRRVVNAHYRAEQLQDYVSDKPDLQLVIEEPEILDTGGGLKAAGPLFQGEAVATLNSDALFAGPNPVSLLQKGWRPEVMDALLLLVPLSQTVGYVRAGNFALGPNGSLSRSPQGQVYTGVQIIKRAPVEAQPGRVFSLNAVWDELLSKGRVHGISYPGRWADVGTPEGIPLAEAMIADG